MNLRMYLATPGRGSGPVPVVACFRGRSVGGRAFHEHWRPVVRDGFSSMTSFGPSRATFFEMRK